MKASSVNATTVRKAKNSPSFVFSVSVMAETYHERRADEQPLAHQ